MPSAFSLFKLRLSVAQVRNDTRPYQTAKYYDRIYSNSFTNPVTLYNANLKPEITTSYEAGLDVRLFNNRLGLDVAVYRNNSRNQIIAIPLDPTTGFQRSLINADLIESNGIEMVMRTRNLNGSKFRWNTTFNWSMDRTYVRELADGLDNQIVGSHSTVRIEARVGGRMGDMYGRGFQRSPDGQIIYRNGLPAPLDLEQKLVGNAFPDWKAGILNEFTMGNVRFSLLVDGQMGGSVFSMSNHKFNTLGKTKVTLPGRDEGIVGDGVVLNSDGTYSPNTVVVSAQNYYDNYYAHSNAETNTFDASFIKVREARIEYGFSTEITKRMGLQRLTIGVFGRDLFLFTNFPAFDPEIAMLNSDSFLPGVEMVQFPSTRTYGLNLTVNF